MIRRRRRRQQADPATLAAIAETRAELRSLAAEEARLRQELGLPPGPSLNDSLAIPLDQLPDQLRLEEAKLRMELDLPAADDGPGGAW